MNAGNTASVPGEGGARYTFQRTLRPRGDDAGLVALSDGVRGFVMGTVAPGYGASVLTAYDLADGRRLWGPRDLGTPAKAFLAPGALYVSAPDHRDEAASAVYRLDPVTGQVRWRTPVHAEHTPVLVGSVLQAGSSSLDAATGRVLRTTVTSGWSRLSDFAADDRWLYHAQHGSVRRLEASTMQVDWSSSTGTFGESDERPVLVGDRLYAEVEGLTGPAEVRDALTGRVLQTLPVMPRAATATSTVDVSWREPVTIEGTRVTVRDVPSGAVRWRRSLRSNADCDCSEQVRSALVVGETLFLSLAGDLYLGGDRVVALHMRTGQQTWQKRYDAHAECQPLGRLTWTGGRLLVPTDCGVQVFQRTG